MSKLGFAACSIDTLGCVCLREFSAPLGGGCTGGGNLALEAADSLSSSKSTESIILLLIGDCEGGGTWRVFRIGKGCSFEGGAGGNSGSERFELSPKGPRGPRESSIASNRVA